MQYVILWFVFLQPLYILKLWLFQPINDKFTKWPYANSILFKEVCSITEKNNTHLFDLKFLSPNIYSFSISEMLQRHVVCVHFHAHSALGYTIHVSFSIDIFQRFILLWKCNIIINEDVTKLNEHIYILLWKCDIRINKDVMSMIETIKWGFFFQGINNSA